jgi:hypothetical protein
MENPEKALSYFIQGYNCSQAVFSTMARHCGIDEDLALKVASGFGGGIGRMQKTCGAIKRRSDHP